MKWIISLVLFLVFCAFQAQAQCSGSAKSQAQLWQEFNYCTSQGKPGGCIGPPQYQDLVCAATPPNSSTNLFPVTGAVGNGTTDDTAAFTTALAACGTAGGGIVQYSTHQYLINSANLTVPIGCVLAGPGPTTGTTTGGGGYLASQPALLLNPTYTINLLGGLYHVAIFSNSIVGLPTGAIQQTLTWAAAFSGTSITIGASDTFLNDVLSVGFTNGYVVNSFGRTDIYNAKIFATNCYSFTNVQSAGWIDHIFCKPFTPFGSAVSTTQTVSSIGSDGSLIQLVVPSTSNFSTGNRAYVLGTGTGANGPWTITKVDSTHIDLQGSQTSPTTTGTWSAGTSSQVVGVNVYPITVASLNSLYPGQGVSGTGLPSNETVQFIDWSTKIIYVNEPPTLNETNQTLTFTNPSYSSGGSIKLDVNETVGTGLLISGTGGTHFHNVAVYGYTTKFHVTGGDLHSVVSDSFCDDDGLGDPNIVCLLVDGSSRYFTFQNVYSTHGISLNQTGSASLTQWIGGTLNTSALTGSTPISISSGQGNFVDIGLNQEQGGTGSVGIAVGSGLNVSISGGSNLISGQVIANGGNLVVSTDSMVSNWEYPGGSPDDNLLVNGEMSIDQAGEGSSRSTLASYIEDSWASTGTNTAGATFTYQRNSSSPLVNAVDDIKIAVGVSGGASPASGDNFRLRQPVESSRLSGIGWGGPTALPVSLVFEEQCSVAGTYSVTLSNGVNSRSYTIPYTLAANSPTSLEFTIPGDVAGSWTLGSNDVTGLNLAFWFTAGSGETTSTLNQWQGVAPLAATGQANLTATNSASCDVGNVRLEPGPIPHFFVPRDPQRALSLAQRLYQKTFSQGIKPQTNAGLGGALCLPATATTAGAWSIQWQLPVTMSIPLTASNITTYNPSANNLNIRDVTAGADLTVQVDPNSAIGSNGVQIGEQTSAMTIGHQQCIQVVADERL